MRRIATLLVLTFMIWTPVPVDAAHDATCHPGSSPGEIQDLEAIQDIVIRYYSNSGVWLRLTGHVDRYDDGEVTVHGVLLLKDGNHTVAYRPAADPAPLATCADTDGDGVAGLTRFTATYELRSGQSLLILVTPRIEIDERGTHDAELVIRGAGPEPISVPITLRVH